MDLPHPKLLPACDLVVELDPLREIGRGRAGQRRIIPIVGGTATGRISGRVLNIGADWQTVFDSGLAQLDTRYAIETHDGATIEVINFGHRHGPAEVLARIAQGEDVPPSDYYMRTHARLESGHPDYDWVNAALFIGVGARKASTVLMRLFEIT